MTLFGPPRNRPAIVAHGPSAFHWTLRFFFRALCPDLALPPLSRPSKFQLRLRLQKR